MTPAKPARKNVQARTAAAAETAAAKTKRRFTAARVSEPDLPAKAGPTDNGPVAQAGSGREGVREALAAASLALAGLLPRLLFARELPAAAFSDFRALIDFGLAMRDHGWSAESWHWIQFNPGL